MTVIIGILCSDGVVIGSDSAMAAGRAGQYTIEWQDGGALKIEVFDPDVITAVTGAFGLAQRFNDQVKATMAILRQPYQPPQQFGFTTQGAIVFAGTPVQQALGQSVAAGAIPYNAISPTEMGRVMAQVAIDDFRRTQSTYQVSNGWGLGALLAFVNKDQPCLIDFDRMQFHPELKGMPDPLRGDQDRISRWVSMGAGQQLADAFLAHANRVLFNKKTPTVDRAKLVVVWAIDHVKRYNLGLVSGDTKLAVLERIDGIWRAHHEDAGQALQQVVELEEHIHNFGRDREPEKAAAAAIDLENVLAQPGSAG